MHKFVIRILMQPIIDENAYACLTESQAKTIVDWLKGNKIKAESMTIEEWEDLKKETKS